MSLETRKSAMIALSLRYHTPLRARGTHTDGRSFATDGHAMVLTADDHGFVQEGEPFDFARMLTLPDVPSRRTTVEALAAWVAEREPVSRCETCGGRPMKFRPCVCDEGRCTCDCGDSHDCKRCGACGEIQDDEGELDCPTCNGVPSLGRDVAQIGAICLNRGLLAMVLACVPASDVVDVRIQDDRKGVYFLGVDWIGIVMPYRDGEPVSTFSGWVTP